MDSQAATELHELAGEDDNAAEIQAVLDAGTDVNSTDEEGDTALHIAARAGALLVCDLLLNAGADVLVRNKKNKTPAGQGRLSDAVKDKLSVAEEQAKERRKQRGANLWNGKIQATQTESALAVGTL